MPSYFGRSRAVALHDRLTALIEFRHYTAGPIGRRMLMVELIHLLLSNLFFRETEMSCGTHTHTHTQSVWQRGEKTNKKLRGLQQGRNIFYSSLKSFELWFFLVSLGEVRNNFRATTRTHTRDCSQRTDGQQQNKTKNRHSRTKESLTRTQKI